MPGEHSIDPTRRLTWRMAAFWMVALAVTLAILGMVVALQQTRSLNMRINAQAQQRAADIADEARNRFRDQLRASLRTVAQDLRSASDVSSRPPDNWPNWIDHVYLWDGAALTAAVQRSDSEEGLVEKIRSRLIGYPIRPPSGRRPLEYELLYGLDAEARYVSACMWAEDAQDRPVVIVGNIHLQRLRTDLVDPLFVHDVVLELVSEDQASGPWSQPMYSPAQRWVIQPTDSFLRQRRFTVTGLTLAYLGLTVLALGTLILAMSLVIRLARREVALAEMKANFVADVSHELKTPLAVIRLFSETLQSGRVASEEKRQEYYSTIIRESTRLTSLIDNILDFARIEAGRKEFALQPTDVGRVIRETYDAYRDQLDQKGFEHSLRIDDDLPEVNGDQDAIAQTLINLMANSIKYSDEERYLALEVTGDTRRGKRGVLISVHDRGIGIRPEDRGHLVEGFFRAADGRVRQAGGAGLGLALVKHIVDFHKGSLDVESRLVKGSTFRIFLPALEHESSGEEKPPGIKPEAC